MGRRSETVVGSRSSERREMRRMNTLGQLHFNTGPQSVLGGSAGKS
jgi:hypothetical protein